MVRQEMKRKDWIDQENMSYDRTDKDKIEHDKVR